MKFSKKLIIEVFTFIAGVLTCLLLVEIITSMNFIQKWAIKEIAPVLTEPMIFGDTEVFPFLDKQGQENLAIKKGGYLFVVLIKDDSGKVSNVIIRDGLEGIISINSFKGNDRISKISLNNPNGGGLFQTFYDIMQSRWCYAIYSGTQYKESQCDNYVDLDYNGIMDFKGLVGKDGKTFQPEIRFGGEWLGITNYDKDAKSASIEKLDGTRTFKFEDANGWIEIK